MGQTNAMKDSLQQKAAQSLQENKRLMARWATGTGKSGIVMKFIQNNPGHGPVLIVVPETNNIENWRNEFDKFGVSDFGVQIICYASLKNYMNTKWWLIVYDEAPHANTDIREAIIETIDADYVLALGAVISNEEQFALEAKYGRFKHSEISLEKAISMGVLPPPRVCVVHTKLDSTIRYVSYKGMNLTEQEAYDAINKELNTAKGQFIMTGKKFWERRMRVLGCQRKRFLGTAKERITKWLCDVVSKRKQRFVCFCTSIAQAERLGGENAFTSKTKNGMELLEKFNSGETDSIYVVGKLIEGQNLNNIECGIIGNIGGTDRITVQICGRIMRAKNPIIYVPVFDFTKDETFLHTLTDNIPSCYIEHYKL